MKRFFYVAICGAALGCSQDKPAQSAYDDERAMTPASGSVERAPGAEQADPRPEREPSTRPEREASNSPGVLRADEPSSADAKAARRDDATRRDDAAGATNAPAPPDNTKVNERDRSDGQKTPLDQGNNETDLRITQQIRQAVQADDALSFTAKNVKIISNGGKVTLRGPVNTAAERNAIEEAARKVAGVLQVDNQLEIKK